VIEYKRRKNGRGEELKVDKGYEEGGIEEKKKSGWKEMQGEERAGDA